MTNMNQINKVTVVALTAVAVVIVVEILTANSDEAYGRADRNIGDGNVGQQNCVDAETTNRGKSGLGSGEENGGNFVGGDLNINSENIGDKNVGQQNCVDAETTNFNVSSASGEDKDGNFVGGDLNINSDR